MNIGTIKLRATSKISLSQRDIRISLVALMVKNLPAFQETQVGSQGWEDLLEKGMAAAAAKSLQSCPTLCNPIDGRPPGSSVHGIFQARILE